MNGKIFISYSKADAYSAAMLAALLQGHGYDVWWDKNLAAGDDFQITIRDELINSWLVVVIWTETSVNSEWVRSEAQFALRSKKLLPVKSDAVEYEKIPPPFNLQHIDKLSDEHKILDAVAERRSAPPPKLQLVHLFRHKLFSWIGVIGIATTILTAIDPILYLADWAHHIIEHWRAWTRMFWLVIADWLKFKLPPDMDVYLSITTFMCWTALTSRLRGAWAIGNGRIEAVGASRVSLINLLTVIVILFVVLIVAQVNILGLFPNKAQSENAEAVETWFALSLAFTSIFVAIIAHRVEFIKNIVSAVALLCVFLGLNFVSIFGDKIRSAIKVPHATPSVTQSTTTK